jgi:hypothetical protein
MLAQAAGDERQAIFREPTDYAHWLVMSRIQTERGQLIVAMNGYNQAEALRPPAAVLKPARYFATPGHPYGILP